VAVDGYPALLVVVEGVESMVRVNPKFDLGDKVTCDVDGMASLPLVVCAVKASFEGFGRPTSGVAYTYDLWYDDGSRTGGKIHGMYQDTLEWRGWYGVVEGDPPKDDERWLVSLPVFTQFRHKSNPQLTAAIFRSSGRVIVVGGQWRDNPISVLKFIELGGKDYRVVSFG